MRGFTTDLAVTEAMSDSTSFTMAFMALLIVAGLSIAATLFGAMLVYCQRQQLQATYTGRRIALDDAFALLLAEQLNLRLEDGQGERFKIMAQQILIAIAGAFGCDVSDLTFEQKERLAEITAAYMLQHKRHYRLKNDCWLGGHQLRLIFMESHRLAQLVYANWDEFNALFAASNPSNSFDRNDFSGGWPYNPENPGLFIQHVYPHVWRGDVTARDAFVARTDGNAIVLRTALWIMHDRGITSYSFLTRLTTQSSENIILNDLMPKMMSALLSSYPFAFKLFSILTVTSFPIPKSLLADCFKVLHPKHQGLEIFSDYLGLFRHAGWIEEGASGIMLVEDVYDSSEHHANTVKAEATRDTLEKRYSAEAKTILLKTLTGRCQKVLTGNDRDYCEAVIGTSYASAESVDANFLQFKTAFEAIGKPPRTPKHSARTTGGPAHAGHSPGNTPPGANDHTGGGGNAAQVVPTTRAAKVRAIF